MAGSMGCGASTPAARAADDDLGGTVSAAVAPAPEAISLLGLGNHTPDYDAFFKSIDTDGDGKVTRSELSAKLQATSELQALFETVVGCPGDDMFTLYADDSGEISLDEFKQMMETNKMVRR